jgi:hypothetical protein
LNSQYPVPCMALHPDAPLAPVLPSCGRGMTSAPHRDCVTRATFHDTGGRLARSSSPSMRRPARGTGLTRSGFYRVLAALRSSSCRVTASSTVPSRISLSLTCSGISSVRCRLRANSVTLPAWSATAASFQIGHGVEREMQILVTAGIDCFLEFFTPIFTQVVW